MGGWDEDEGVALGVGRRWRVENIFGVESWIAEDCGVGVYSVDGLIDLGSDDKGVEALEVVLLIERDIIVAVLRWISYVRVRSM